MSKLTPEMLAEIPVWALEQMALPRGKFSREEQQAAKQEIRRRYGLPAGAIKIPPPEPPLPDASALRSIQGGGWYFENPETEQSNG